MVWRAFVLTIKTLPDRRSMGENTKPEARSESVSDPLSDPVADFFSYILLFILCFLCSGRMRASFDLDEMIPHFSCSWTSCSVSVLCSSFGLCAVQQWQTNTRAERRPDSLVSSASSEETGRRWKLNAPMLNAVLSGDVTSLLPAVLEVSKSVIDYLSTTDYMLTFCASFD